MSSKLDMMNKKIVSMQKVLNDLANSEIILRYNRLNFEFHELISIRNELYRNEKMMEYDSCNHIWINENSGSKYCIKCGLSTIYNNLEHINYDSLDVSEQVMIDYLNSDSNNTIDNGITFDIEGEKSDISWVYQKVKKEHPDLSDEEILEYIRSSISELNKNKDDKQKKLIKIK